MLAIQKLPQPHTFSSPASRSAHCRHPSAPVVVRATHTPGLLSLSKPATRPQQPQQPRQQRSSPKGKPHQRSPQLSHATAQAPEDAKKQAASAPQADDAPSERPKQATPPAPSPDKSARGRQSAKDKAQRRSTSHSTSRGNARRPPHQPSPPPTIRVPSQAEVSPHRFIKPASAQTFRSSEPNSNLFDPFVVNTASVSEPHAQDTNPTKVGPKVPSFQLPPRLASQPNGKLARRRRLITAPSSPTPPKAVPVSVPRRKTYEEGLVSRSEPALVPMAHRSKGRRVSGSVPVAHRDEFPICDDSSDLAEDSDDTPPTTPIRETASVPAKKGTAWLLFDDGPRTAPLSSTIGFPFHPPGSASTPSPAQRRRAHPHVPSEGVFNMSMDEDSSCSSSEALESLRHSSTALPRRRVVSAAEPHSAESGVPCSPNAAFYAGSIFQNSPSPDDLPAPSFHP